MAGTLKVGSVGRFGSRYGVGIRRKLLKIEPLQLQKHVCPSCGSRRVKRLSKGIFSCSKCLHEFVGGSYVPQTLAGGIISKMVSQRAFAPELVETLSKGQNELFPNQSQAKAEAKVEEKVHFPEAKKHSKKEEQPAEVEEELQEDSTETDSEGEES